MTLRALLAGGAPPTRAPAPADQALPLAAAEEPIRRSAPIVSERIIEKIVERGAKLTHHPKA